MKLHVALHAPAHMYNAGTLLTGAQWRKEGLYGRFKRYARNKRFVEKDIMHKVDHLPPANPHVPFPLALHPITLP